MIKIVHFSKVKRNHPFWIFDSAGKQPIPCPFVLIIQGLCRLSRGCSRLSNPFLTAESQKLESGIWKRGKTEEFRIPYLQSPWYFPRRFRAGKHTGPRWPFPSWSGGLRSWQARIGSKNRIGRNRIHCHCITVKNHPDIIRKRAEEPGRTAPGKWIVHFSLFPIEIDPAPEGEYRVFHSDADRIF